MCRSAVRPPSVEVHGDKDVACLDAFHLKAMEGFEMPFESDKEVRQRLLGPEPLSMAEITDLMPWLNGIPAGLRDVCMSRIEFELAIHNIASVKKFDRSSKRLSWAMITLTVGLLILTVVIAYFTIQLSTLSQDRPQNSSSTRSEVGDEELVGAAAATAKGSTRVATRVRAGASF